MQQCRDGLQNELEGERKNVQELVVKMQEVENEMSSYDQVGVWWRAKGRVRVKMPMKIYVVAHIRNTRKCAQQVLQDWTIKLSEEMRARRLLEEVCFASFRCQCGNHTGQTSLLYPTGFPCDPKTTSSCLTGAQKPKIYGGRACQAEACRRG